MTGALIYADQLLVERRNVLHLFAIGALQAHVHDVRAVLHLPARDLDRFFPLLLRDQVLERARPDHVRPLARQSADDCSPSPPPVRCPSNRRGAPARRNRARLLLPSPSARWTRICASVVPQQPPTIFSQPCRTNFSNCAASDLRRLAVLAFHVRQPGVRIAGNQRRRHLADGADVVRHQFRPGGAIQADREQIRRARSKLTTHPPSARPAWCPSVRWCPKPSPESSCQSRLLIAESPAARL